jgi:hypothetical protein
MDASHANMQTGLDTVRAANSLLFTSHEPAFEQGGYWL